jgi:hypothetical protein
MKTTMIKISATHRPTKQHPLQNTNKNSKLYMAVFADSCSEPFSDTLYRAEQLVSATNIVKEFTIERF